MCADQGVAALQARAVDPRSVTWQVDAPVFWVTFFRRAPHAAEVPSPLVGHESEEWELTGGDVSEAGAWAANMPVRGARGHSMSPGRHQGRSG